MGLIWTMSYIFLISSLASIVAKEIVHESVAAKDNESQTSKLHFHEIKIKVVPRKQNDDRQNIALAEEFIDLRFKMNKTFGNILFETRTIDIPYLAWGLFFKKGLQVFQSIMVGEADLKEIAYDSLCFIDVLDRRGVVDIESMQRAFKINKEPQKAEIMLDKQHVTIDLKLIKQNFKHFGNEIEYLCSAAQTVFTTSETINYLAAGNKELKAELMSGMKLQATRNDSSYPLCEEAVSMWDLGCLCKRLLCIPWYPCGLKYCPGTSGDKNDKIACGILTCAKCTEYEFYVERKDQCFWNIKDD